MYYNKKKMIISIMWVIIGATLLVLDIIGVMDNPAYSGMGGGLLVIGMMQIYKNFKYHSNEEYKEKIDLEYKDERNGYIRMKAWAWAGYLFIIGAAVVSIVLFVMKMTLIGQIVSYCMCAVLMLYWISYLVLQRKY